MAMVKKVESFLSDSGKLFLTQESAVRHDAMERLCEVMPEFQMIRNRLESQLDAIAAAVAPMVDFNRAKTTPETTFGDHPETTVAVVDHGELEGTCDCSAGMNGASDHHSSCPSFKPVILRPSKQPMWDIYGKRRTNG